MERGEASPGASDLQRITDRLDRVAAELGADPDDERAAALIKEAADLASEAGEALERALRPAEKPES